MQFFKKLDELKLLYSQKSIIRNNGTVLLSPGDIPRSRHMLFRPLAKEYIESYLIEQYNNKFPKDYINFLLFSNGANLFSVKIVTSEFIFSHSLFVIFGLPMTPPLGRPLDMEEPFDVRVESLSMHKDIPKSWLKCGTYTRMYNFDIQTDIFIDTLSQRVYACEKGQNDIINEWSNLDNCFCDIFDSLSDCELEYIMNE